jgi:predicted  nucleic acid-binding Zn-ribbon protein
MQEIIEKLLILQDRDRKIVRVTQELAHIGPERETLRANAIATQNQLEAARTRVKHLESERKQLELEVETKKAQIEKYANQQLQTRKNEEYKALAHEIETCKADITKIEDKEIVLMEQTEVAQKEVARAKQEAAAAKKLVEEQIGLLNEREANFKKDLAELQSGRTEIAAA